MALDSNQKQKALEAVAIKKLEMLTFVGPGTIRLPDSQKMLSTIEEVEREFSFEITPSLAEALADATLCYTSWFVRGADRKPFLERAVRYYRLSGKKEKLGRLLVEEAQVRNLKEAISLLEDLFANSDSYIPALCNYADALYKDGQYFRAYEAATHIHGLAEKTKNRWDVQMEQLKRRGTADASHPEYRTALENYMSSLPTAPMQIAAKALRAEAKRLKKAGQEQEAITMLERLQETGQTTATDTKQLERLRMVKRS